MDQKLMCLCELCLKADGLLSLLVFSVDFVPLLFQMVGLFGEIVLVVSSHMLFLFHIQIHALDAACIFHMT